MNFCYGGGKDTRIGSATAVLRTFKRQGYLPTVGLGLLLTLCRTFGADLNLRML